MRVFENRLLRRIFGPKMDGIRGEWRRLHNKELHALYCSPNITWVIKSRTLIRPILTYGAETWAATESELQKLLICERKILRKIYGPVKDRDNWRIRIN
jgi:hypothetical protein